MNREQEGAPTLFARMAELICPKSEPVADAVTKCAPGTTAAKTAAVSAPRLCIATNRWTY